jgi:hypothetical protein
MTSSWWMSSIAPVRTTRSRSAGEPSSTRIVRPAGHTSSRAVAATSARTVGSSSSQGGRHEADDGASGPMTQRGC